MNRATRLGTRPAWPWIGLVLVPVGVAWLLLAGPPITSFDGLLILAALAMPLHQAEEYLWPGDFRVFFNHAVLGGDVTGPLTPRRALVVNLIVAWVALPAMAWQGSATPVFGLVGLAVLLVNGLLHGLTSLLARRYTAGTLTGLLVFVPLGVLGGEAALAEGLADTGALRSLVGAALLGHLALVAILRLAGRRAPDDTANR